MLTIFKQSCLSVLLSLVAVCSLANVGQPGVWHAGGGMNPFIQADSLVNEKITMQSEKITMVIYTGFAILHGQYKLLNNYNEPVSFTMGYPINS